MSGTLARMVAIPSSVAPVASTLTLAPGAVLLRRGEPVDHVMHVLQGRVVIIS